MSPASDIVWLVKTDANGNVAGGTRKGQLPGTTTEQAGTDRDDDVVSAATPANGPAAATADSP
jgi:hypothetical protein